MSVSITLYGIAWAMYIIGMVSAIVLTMCDYPDEAAKFYTLAMLGCVFGLMLVLIF